MIEYVSDEQFKEIVLKELKNVVGEDLTYDYVDRYDGLNEEQIKGIMEDVENLNPEKIKNALDSAYENDDFMNYISEIENYILKQVSDELNTKYFLNEEQQDEIADIVYDNLIVDIMDGLTKNTQIKELYISLEKEAKNEGDYMSYIPFQNLKNHYTSVDGLLNLNEPDIEELNEMDNEEIEELIENTDLNWLIQTQGYNFEDLYDKEKLENSEFLKSLKNEMTDWYNVLSSFTFTFAIPEISLNDMIDIFSNENKTIKIAKETECGLVGITKGSGCGMEVKLEKDIIVPFEKIGRVGSEYWGYTPCQIFGAYFTKGGISNSKDEKPIKEKTLNVDKLRENIIKNKKEM